MAAVYLAFSRGPFDGERGIKTLPDSLPPTPLAILRRSPCAAGILHVYQSTRPNHGQQAFLLRHLGSVRERDRRAAAKKGVNP